MDVTGVGRLVAGTLAFGAVALAGVVAGAQPTHVELCHATGSKVNPYVMIPPGVNGAFKGHYTHHEGDIIPPFEYQGKTYSLNWDATGQAIFNNGCVVPENPEVPPEVPPEVLGEPPIVNEPPFTG